MNHFRKTGVALAALLIAGACSSGSSDTFPAATQGVGIPTESVVDINKGFQPPMVYTQDFHLKDCKWKPHGVNLFYDPLVPGFKQVSAFPGKTGEYTKKPIDYRKTYEVLKETKKLNVKGLGKIEAAIVEEREYEDGKYFQQALNWYAICEQTGNVYAVGEDSFTLIPDPSKPAVKGGIKDTEGSWQAGKVNAKGEAAVPSMAMPAVPAVGMRTIFDGAPGVALGGAEIITTLSTNNGKLTLVPTKEGFPGREVEIPITKSVGDFHGCVQIQEISQKSDSRRPDMGDLTNKVWCPGVGLIYDTSDGALVEHNALQDKKFAKKLEAFKK